MSKSQIGNAFRLIISFIFFTNNPTTSKITADKKIKNSGMIGIKILTNIPSSQLWTG